MFCTCTFCTLHTLLSALTVYFVFSLPLSYLSQLWVCAYFPKLAPDPEVEAPLEVLYSRRFEVDAGLDPKKPCHISGIILTQYERPR